MSRVVNWIFKIALLSAVFACASSGPGYAQSQRMYCDALGDIAVDMRRTPEFTPEHYPNASQKQLAQEALRCEQSGEDIKQCIVKQCMEGRI